MQCYFGSPLELAITFETIGLLSRPGLSLDSLFLVYYNTQGKQKTQE